MSVPVKVYDDNLEIVADLQNATDIQYNKRLNEIWSASFTLPADDDKNDLFGLLNFARIYDGEKNIGLFRIDEKYPQRSEEDTTIRYECSHVLDTLNDDYVALTAKETKTGTSTAINYILDQQTTTNWELGTLDFSKNFEHEFSRQTLFNALLQVPQPWWEDYEITFDTSSYPWTINIVQPDSTPKATLRYGKNMASIEKEVNAKELVTKLYAYGSGSGDDQVTAGPYTSNTGTYGTIVGIWEEQYFDNASDLGTAAQKYLSRVDTPRVVYRGDAADLYRILDINEIELGEYITIYDPELGEDTKAQVVEMRKSDMTGDPGRLQLELSNKSRRFPNYGALAFRDKATEDNLASGSVGGGALSTGGVGSTSLANEAVTWDKIKFKDDSGDYFEQTRLKIDALATFENNFTEIDKLEDGTTYAKMRKDWRSASDVTKIAGGEIYTDSVDLDRINFSPTSSKNIVGQINANDNGVTINTDILDISGSTSITLSSDGSISLNASNVDITSLNDDGSWGSRISANEDQISLNVTDIDDNESAIQVNSDEIALKVDANIEDVMSYINLSDEGIIIGTDGTGTSEIQLKPSGRLQINADDQLDISAPDIDITSLNDDGSWGSRIGTNEDEIDLRVKENDVINAINVSTEGIQINADRITLGSALGQGSNNEIVLELATDMTINSDNNLTLNASSVDITSLNDDGSWGSRIGTNEDEIDLRVKENDVINAINVSTEGILIEGNNIELDGDTTVQGDFEVQGKNVTLDANTTITGDLDFQGYNSITGLNAAYTGGVYSQDGTQQIYFGSNIEIDSVLMRGPLNMNGLDINDVGTISGLDVNLSDINVDTDLDMGFYDIEGSGNVYGFDMSGWSESSTGSYGGNVWSVSSSEYIEIEDTGGTTHYIYAITDYNNEGNLSYISH